MPRAEIRNLVSSLSFLSNFIMIYKRPVQSSKHERGITLMKTIIPEKEQKGSHMANQEQLDLLRHGVAEWWNNWRQLSPDILLNLDNTDLSEWNLGGFDLSHAHLRGADLTRADLNHANLSAALFTDANLSEVNLASANVSGADFSGANMRNAYLRDANLNGVRLTAEQLKQVDEGAFPF
jgi:uncharacterized protein YjbI with pentapeptide repeats